ncbi:MAG: acetyl-CoA decarbonylase/synthase complex subunit gamma [Firmicutes bacterium]|nr:acetyl-CoA decarbonylase/synthase complex subunit gamma [Bacillota bacterium]
MALTGLEIYKLLPKKNCRECGSPTCLAFAMQLAQGKGSLDACPYVSEEAKEKLGAASQPPIRLVTIGTGEHALQVGDETVLFRHDKTFFHQPPLAVTVYDDWEDARIQARLAELKAFSWERVGLVLRVDMVAVVHRAEEPGRLAAAAQMVQAALPYPLYLESAEAGAVEAALQAVGAGKPLIAAATPENWQAWVELAKKYGCPLVVSAEGLDALAELAEKVAAAGVKDLVLDSRPATLVQALTDQTQIRRLAIRKKFRPLGYPTLVRVPQGDAWQATAYAATLIAKYGGVLLLPAEVGIPNVLPLVTLRQNIYTDPQKPIQVQPGIYPVGEPGPDAPVLVTTNFSLTYFTVMSDVEASKIPAYMLICDTDGTSVLTAWAAGKFSAESIAETMDKFKLAEKVNHRRLILPGFVAVLSGKLQSLTNWEVVVGPRESAGLPNFLRARLSA